MNKKILLGGGSIFLASLLYLNGTETSMPTASTMQPTPSPGDGKQRFMLFSTPVSNGSVPVVYVIDTQTGRIWRQTVFTDVRGTYLVPLTYLSADQTTASVAPTANEALDSQSLQKQYNAQVEIAKQHNAVGQPAVAPPVQSR